MNPASFFVAGAAQFCLAEPAHVACSPPPAIERVALTRDRLMFLLGLADRMYRDEQAQARPDIFREAALAHDDYRGDCGPKVLWALGQISQHDRAAFGAARPVVWFDRDGAHSLLLIVGETHALLMDGVTERAVVYTLDELRAREHLIYHAPDGIQNRWVPITRLVSQPRR